MEVTEPQLPLTDPIAICKRLINACYVKGDSLWIDTFKAFPEAVLHWKKHLENHPDHNHLIWFIRVLADNGFVDTKWADKVLRIKMTAWEYIQRIKYAHAIPHSTEIPCTLPTNAEIKRWFEKKSIVINGIRANKDDIIVLPVTQLVFFPKSEKGRCTVL